MNGGIMRLRSAVSAVASRRVMYEAKRGFGAAAALEDYDYYDVEDMNDERRMGVVESERFVSGRGVQWVFIGNPGAQKRLYAERLSKLLQVPYISMGTLVRQDLNPRSSLYKQIANAINEGKLVQEDVIFGLLSKRLEEGYFRGETGFILDGIPRTSIQAEILDQIADIDLVVNFKCTEECLTKKHPGNRFCSHCRDSLSAQKSGPTTPSWFFQKTQLDSLKAEYAQKEELHNNTEQKKPLEDYYRQQKKLIDFQVVRGPGETWQELLNALHLKQMNAVYFSKKLTI